MDTEKNLICSFGNEPLYWTPAHMLSEIQKFEYNLHEDDNCSFEGIAEFLGSIATIYMDDEGQQYYFYLDDIENSDEDGYECGTCNPFWEEAVACEISRLRGINIDVSNCKYPDSSEEQSNGLLNRVPRVRIPFGVPLLKMKIIVDFMK